MQLVKHLQQVLGVSMLLIKGGCDNGHRHYMVMSADG